MGKNYLIFGTKRTGNHAIIHWLRPQIGEVVRFFNDQKYVFSDLTNLNDEHYLVEHALQLWRTKIFINNERKRRSEVFLTEHKDVDNIISFEDVELNQMLELEDQWLQDLNRGIKTINPEIKISGDNTYIVILRNPWNIVASQINANFIDNNNIDNNIDMWNEYYEYYLKQDNNHYIIYDKWFTDIDYRKKISGDLGLEFNDININKVWKVGGGSSFDDMKYDGRAQEMDVLNRYEQIKDDKKMQEFLKTDEALDLKNKWNHICDLENMDLKIK